MATPIILFELLLALSISVALATDHSPLQDFCVADAKSQGMTILFVLWLSFLIHHHGQKLKLITYLYAPYDFDILFMSPRKKTNLLFINLDSFHKKFSRSIPVGKLYK